MTGRFTLPAFAAYGIELEYAIVQRSTLDVLPIAQDLLQRLESDGHHRTVDSGVSMGWSNELVQHVVECKNVAPVASLESLSQAFQAEIQAANRTLAGSEACLMPTGMHPWMDPQRDAALWTHSQADIYLAYDRIFGCRTHGWSNVQSMHINLPFADDAQFARLHAAIRLVVPLLPALAASSPIAGGSRTGLVDYRLEVYRTHMQRTPSVTGDVVPETVGSRREYEARILQPMYDEIDAYDPEHVLRHEWLNARGAIARFDRDAIEIRVVDIQECIRADLAIAAATVAAVKLLYDERWSSLSQQQDVPAQALATALWSSTRLAGATILDDPRLLRALGRRKPCTISEFWGEIVDAAGESADAAWWRPLIAFIIDNGCLAQRILRAAANDFSRERLRQVYSELCGCLDRGQLFE